MFVPRWQGEVPARSSALGYVGGGFSRSYTSEEVDSVQIPYHYSSFSSGGGGGGGNGAAVAGYASDAVCDPRRGGVVQRARKKKVRGGPSGNGAMVAPCRSPSLNPSVRRTPRLRGDSPS